MPKPFVVEQTYFFRVGPSRVFAALTQPGLLERWFLSHAEVEPRKGGSFVFVWSGGYRMSARLLQYARNRTVTFQWVDQFPKRKVVTTSASFRVSRRGRGTLLKLRHSGFTDPEHFASSSSGWAYFLTNLKSVLEHGFDLRSELDG